MRMSENKNFFPLLTMVENVVLDKQNKIKYFAWGCRVKEVIEFNYILLLSCFIVKDVKKTSGTTSH